MSVRPTDILREARDLFSDNAQEVRYRTVVSRAYYAAFHHTKSYAETQGFKGNKGRSIHRDIINFLAGHKNADNRYRSHRLDQLRNLRNRADYRLEMNFGTPMAEDALNDAAEIVGDIQTVAP